ncbi:LOW QUALITY PROTEIN: uncharacterized protein [Macrobrachium rosenbergii]|uniref:LOW QUALITY PROTEIN: uncharacterized protein n=1 Tax=Macrobrachium rosenbergii TaxID=79674 RepID=UPI0034D6D37E
MPVHSLFLQVCLQDVLSEVEDDRLIPDATRDAVLALYEEIQGPTPSIATPATNRSLVTECHDIQDQANPMIKLRKIPTQTVELTPNPRALMLTTMETTLPDLPRARTQENLPSRNESTSQRKKASRGWANTGGSDGDSSTPNLHHLLKLTEALRRNTRILNLTVGQAGSFVYFEATRAFGGLFGNEEELCNKVLKITKKHFKEVEEHLAWWPGVTEEGRKMMMHSKDYSEFLKNVQYPEGMKPIMFTNAHFSCLLKLVLTMETVNGHAIILGPPGVGKMALTKLAAYYTRASSSEVVRFGGGSWIVHQQTQQVQELYTWARTGLRVSCSKKKSQRQFSASSKMLMGRRQGGLRKSSYSIVPVAHAIRLGLEILQGLSTTVLGGDGGTDSGESPEGLSGVKSGVTSEATGELPTPAAATTGARAVSTSASGEASSWSPREGVAIRSTRGSSSGDGCGEEEVRCLHCGGGGATEWCWGRTSPEEVLTQQEFHSGPDSTHYAKAVRKCAPRCRDLELECGDGFGPFGPGPANFLGKTSKLLSPFLWGYLVGFGCDPTNFYHIAFDSSPVSGGLPAIVYNDVRNSQPRPMKLSAAAQWWYVLLAPRAVPNTRSWLTLTLAKNYRELEAAIWLGEAERDLNTLQLEQRQLQQQLGQCERELSELQARYEACVCRRQQLEGGIKRATARLQRCTRLTTVLADEDSRWSAKIKTLMVEAEGVYGECTVSGVAVAYFGSLEPALRESLRSLVIQVLLEGGVVTPSKHDLVETLSTPEVRETWEDAGLYRDSSCFLQAAFVFSAVRRPLVLDPDFVCTRWLTKLYEESGGLQVLHAGDEGVVPKVVAAAHAQKPILILQTPTHLTYNLRKILQIPQAIQGADGGVLEVKIVLVTGDSAPVLPQELCVYVTRVSFALPPLVLEERLLNDVLKMERSDLFDQQSNLTASITRDQKSLDAVDDTILKKLTQTSTSLLDNEELLAAFYEAKSTSAEFRTRLGECQRTLQKIGNVRDKYRPVATRGRLLFSTSTALKRLDPSYIFSFQHFLHLFSLCITSGGRGEALSFDQRISSLVESVTELVVNHVSRALHPNHRLAFITALCAAVAANEGHLTPPAWRVILHPSRYEEREALESVLGLDEEFDLTIKDLLRGKRLLVTFNNLVMEVGLLGSKGHPEAPRGRISDFNAFMLLRLTKPQMMVAGARELANCMLGDPTLHKPDLALTKLLGSDERKYPVLVRSDYGRDVAGEVLASAQARGLAGITRVIMPTTAQKVNPLEKVGVAHLATVLLNAIQQGGWIVVQGAESPAILPTLLEAMNKTFFPNRIVLCFQVHEDFRLVVTVGVADESPCELTLLARPVHLQPAPTFLATLSTIATLINHHHYRHHYLGAEWRRAIWKAAAVHTMSTVCRHWQSHPKPSLQPAPTLTPRTQVSSLKSQPSLENPSLLDSSLRWQRECECEARPRGGGLDGHINLCEISTTFSYLYNLSLSHPLSDDTLRCFLGASTKHGETVSVVRREETWGEVISSMPEEVGVVSKEAAVSIVSAHIASCLPNIHSLAMEVEYENFQKDLEAITQGMFDKPPEQEPEEVEE